MKGNLFRYLVVAGSIAGLVLVGRTFSPQSSKADGIDPLPAPPAAKPAAPPSRDGRGRPFVGELITATHSILIYADDAGPRYTIRTLTGEVLARDLAPDEVYREFPGLDLQDLHFSPDGPGRLIGEADAEVR